MRAEKTGLNGCYLIHNTIFNDDRGYFFESFNAKKFREQTGWDVLFVQDNQSFSTKNVLRGLHFQKGEAAQAKLVRVLKGAVLDVAVDLNKNSSTYKKYFSVVLSESSNTQLFIPRGFAHGFLVLSETAEFFYKCDNYYNKSAESGLIYNDSEINIDWQIQPNELLISSKDKELLTLKDLESEL